MTSGTKTKVSTKQSIVVTGAAGFIGSNLCRMLLDEGYRVIAVDNLSAGTVENMPNGVEFHKADIRYPFALMPAIRGAHAVFHLAAKNCLIDCLENPEETVAVNVQGTVNVLEACRASGVSRFIYADTSAEYEGIDVFPTSTDRVAPIATYAVSKRAAWLFCDSYARLNGLRLTTLRYFNVYGPAQDFRRVVPPVMSAFIMKLLAGERPFIYGNGEKRRDFIYVDDVNRFHLLCLRDDRTVGGIYNVGSGVNYSIKEVFRTVEAMLKTGLTPEQKPDLPGEAQMTLADIRKEKELGWEPQIGLREGIERSIAYIKEKVIGAGR